jgi:hypothetical protein
MRLPHKYHTQKILQPGPLPGWSLSILAALALSACTACDLEPQKWLDQHAPAAQPYAGIADAVPFLGFVRIPQSKSAKRGLNTLPAQAVLVFDPIHQELVRLVNINGKLSYYSGGAYDPSTKIDWFTDRFSMQLFGVDRTTGALIPQTWDIGPHLPGPMTTPVRSDGRVFIFADSTADSNSRALCQIYDLHAGKKLVELPVPSWEMMSFYDGQRYNYIWATETTNGVAENVIVQIDLELLAAKEVYRTAEQFFPFPPFWIGERCFFIVEDLERAAHQRAAPEIWEYDQAANTFIGKLQVPRSDPTDLLYQGYGIDDYAVLMRSSVASSPTPTACRLKQFIIFQPGQLGLPETWNVQPQSETNLEHVWLFGSRVRRGDRVVLIGGEKISTNNQSYLSVINLRTLSVECSRFFDYPLVP